MPLTALSFGAASLALAGVPPLAGFWSADKILAQAVTTHVGFGVLMVVLIFLASVYISRAGMAVFAAWPGAPAPSAHDPGMLMTLPTLLLALAALGAGWAMSGHLEAMLEFAAGHELGGDWRVTAIVASLAGLAFGTWRVHAAGPVPAFGALPARGERGLNAATVTPGRLVVSVAGSLQWSERGLDSAIRTLGHGVLAFANAYASVERRLDTTIHAFGRTALTLANAHARVERCLDRADHTLGEATLALAGAS